VRGLLIAVAVLVVVFVGGPYLYFNVIEGKAPKKLSLSTATTAKGQSASGSSSPDGKWNVAAGSQAGYRIKEVAFGQNREAVGRTNAITGNLDINGTKVTQGTYTVDMTTVTSDESRRDNQFRGRIMQVDQYPTATFALTQPIDLGSVPADGVDKTVRAQGNLTLHGVTKPVTMTLTARRSEAGFQASGSIPITFADWNVGNPSFGPVTTEDHGLLEFLLNFGR